MSRLVPSFSEHIKPRARIVSLEMLIENPDGELVMMRPDAIEGFELEVETEWEGRIYAKLLPKGLNGRLEMSFRASGIIKTEGEAVGLQMTWMEYKVLPRVEEK